MRPCQSSFRGSSRSRPLTCGVATIPLSGGRVTPAAPPRRSLRAGCQVRRDSNTSATDPTPPDPDPAVAGSPPAAPVATRTVMPRGARAQAVEDTNASLLAEPLLTGQQVAAILGLRPSSVYGYARRERDPLPSLASAGTTSERESR